MLGAGACNDTEFRSWKISRDTEYEYEYIFQSYQDSSTVSYCIYEY
jgi:hypothetical protein